MTTELETPILRVDRAYTAAEAAQIMGLNVSSFNERVREGWIKPIPIPGIRRFSGYTLTQILGWPAMPYDPRDYTLRPRPKPTILSH